MRDNIILSDGTDIVIVNQYSCCELFKWLIVEYAGVSYQQANACVETRIPFFEGIDTFLSASLHGHDWPYYYSAMDMYFGNHLPENAILPPPDSPEGLALYENIEAGILRKHNLKEPIIWI
ncbi:MAG: hypothetical protein K2P18_03505 [Oscillospiraceae bacterium]|nr:hypothetical protein [Oscillospiraceae bacterium]